jgi:predicted nucleic-acid-binding Zn-ribbon protein
MIKGMLVQQRWTEGLFKKYKKFDTYACKKCGYLESYLQK